MCERGVEGRGRCKEGMKVVRESESKHGKNLIRVKN